MQNLIKQEQFELEVLDRLNSKRLLAHLVFGGGTMLRLCFGLNRFSVDLDFYFEKTPNCRSFFQALREYLSNFYTIKDATSKFHAMLFEVKSKDYPRSLKIEIRKELKKIKTERAIAYSKYFDTQVFLKVVSLKDMMSAKIEAFLNRKEIRDAFDIEFLLKKGIELDASAAALRKVLSTIDAQTKKDYQVKLGPILDKEERAYYTHENFKILKAAIAEKLKIRLYGLRRPKLRRKNGKTRN